MNKRIKKKRRLGVSVHLLQTRVTLLERTNNLQQEVIEDYGRQIGDLKRRVAELEKVGGCNALACNNHFDQLEAENKALWQEIEALKHQLKPKRSFFNRK